MHRSAIPLVAAALLAGCASGAERETTTTTTTPGAGGPAVGQVAEPRLAQYVELRRQLESQDPQMAAAFQSGDLSRERDTLEAALAGSTMSVDEFLQVHEQVQRDPSLRARVDSAMGRPGGTTGTGGETAPGWRGAPSASPPTTSGAGGAAPSASPQ